MGDIKLDGETRNLESDNVRALAEAFPEVVADGKVDFDKLKLILGEDIDETDERYSFTWPGKRDAIKMAISRSTGTLRPDKKSSKDWDTTENLFIEGDNLEVLRVLQNSYRGKVKMIYIDPPYNTGKDFVYKDDFKDNLRNYKENANLEGQSNPETAGRYHTNWLNMMYPRLRLAKNLLKDDGVIFISIDDHEVHNLRKICDEIFGEDNFISDIIWNSTKSVTNTALVSVAHTHTLVYARKLDYWTKNRHEFRLPESGDGFTNPDNDPRGPWKADPFLVGGWRPNQQYEIANPNTGEIYKPQAGNSWKNDFDKFQELIKDNRIVFGTGGEAGPQRKRFLSEALERGRVTTTLWSDVETTTNGTQTVKSLFDGYQVFTNPKPVGLLKQILQLCTTHSKDSLVLDFFAGSATSAHAVMDLNAEDGGNRRFIMVQIPEATPDASEARKAGYKTIAEISRKRINLAGEKVKADYKDKLAERTTPLDIGFKTFTLDTTNFREWDSNTDNIQDELLAALETFKGDRTSEDALYEVLLKYGIDITEPVEVLTLAGKQVYSLAGNYLLVCLEKDIPFATIEAMATLKPERVVCYDDGFADEDIKQNALETLKRAGVADVRVV